MTAAEKRERRSERHAEQVRQLEQSCRELLADGGLARYIETRRAFHTYSLNNQILLAFQRPTVNGEPVAEHATHVAGFRKWKDFDRAVVKGAKGLRIFAPMIVKDRDAEPDANGEQPRKVLFRVVSVFDISQTDGAPLPERPEAASIAGENHADVLDRLAMFAADKVEGLGLRVSEVDLSEHAAKGWFDPAAGEIVYDANLSTDEKLSVLAHETAHALGVGYDEYGRARAEVIVETAATVALAALGYDTAGASLPYIAEWGSGDDMRALRADLEKIDAIATRLETAFGILDGEPEPAEVAA